MYVSTAFLGERERILLCTKTRKHPQNGLISASLHLYYLTICSYICTKIYTVNESVGHVEVSLVRRKRVTFHLQLNMSGAGMFYARAYF